MPYAPAGPIRAALPRPAGGRGSRGGIRVGAEADPAALDWTARASIRPSPGSSRKNASTRSAPAPSA